MPDALVTLLSPGSARIGLVDAAVTAAGGRVVGLRHVARRPVEAVALEVDGLPPAAHARTAAALRAAALDALVLDGRDDPRRRRLVVTDVDSTLIEQEVVELLAAHAGKEAEVAAVTERAMRGELDFAASLHERVATLAGLPVTVLDDVLDQVRLTPGADVLVRTCHRLGWPVGVVSGGFLEVVRPLCDTLGVRHAEANRLEVADGRLTGRVVGAVVDRGAKAVALRRFAAQESVPLERAVGLGDGANDLDLLATAGTGIAFCGKPALRERADATVSVRRLDAALLLLGLAEADLAVGRAPDAAPGLGTSPTDPSAGGSPGSARHGQG